MVPFGFRSIVCLLLSGQGLTIKCWLISNWWSSCLTFLSVGITDMYATLNWGYCFWLNSAKVTQNKVSLKPASGTFHILFSIFSRFYFSERCSLFSVFLWDRTQPSSVLFSTHLWHWPCGLLGSCFLGCLKSSVVRHGRETMVGFIQPASPELSRPSWIEMSCWFVC